MVRVRVCGVRGVRVRLWPAVVCGAAPAPAAADHVTQAMMEEKMMSEELDGLGDSPHIYNSSP